MADVRLETWFSYDMIFVYVYYFLVRFVYFPWVFFHSRATGACTVTTDLIMRINENDNNNNWSLYGDHGPDYAN